MNKLPETLEQLNQLTKRAEQRDQQKGEHHHALFDVHLFQSRSRLLSPYVAEAHATYQSIIAEKHANRLSIERAQYLTERLWNQISAIERELTTQVIRNNEIKHAQHDLQPINELYQDLSQHQQWEMQLRDQVRQYTALIEKGSSYQRPQMLKALLHAETRLEKCIAAKIKIENIITYREKQNLTHDTF